MVRAPHFEKWVYATPHNVAEAKHTPHFKPGKELRDRVNESRATTAIKDHDDDDTDNDEPSSHIFDNTNLTSPEDHH